MTYNCLLEQLNIYQTKWPEEIQTIQRFREFILAQPHCFDRSLIIGHITGSGLVVDATLGNILLTHHAKLGKWLQLGGHSDGNPLTHETALRECKEESGITDLKLWNTPPEIFDLDIHTIPERKNEPEHLHFDVRYLVISNSKDFTKSNESHALKWFRVEEAFQITREMSMLRQFEKLSRLATFEGKEFSMKSSL